MILFQFFPLYVFRRPVFSNIYEFFLQAVLIYILVKDSKTKFLSKIKWWFSIIIGVIIGLVIFVRYNNFFFTLLWPIALFCFENNKFNLKNSWKKLSISYLVGIIILFLFKIIPVVIIKLKVYGGAVPKFFLKINNPLFYIKVFLNMIFGVDFGLIFTAPFLLVGIVCLFVLKFDFKKRLIIAFMPIIINLFLVLNSGSQFGWYGYRLLFFSIIPFLIFPFALFLKNLKEKVILKKWLIVFYILSIFPIISLLAFEGNSTNLTLNQGVQYFGMIDWGNKFYQLEIWKTLFLYPLEFFKAILKGGPLYLIYLFSKLFNFQNKLPLIVTEKYPIFRTDVLIKTLIIYLFPFILFFILKIQHFKNHIKIVFSKKNT